MRPDRRPAWIVALLRMLASIPFRLLCHHGWPWLAAAVSGGLLAMGFAPFNQAWLAWIGLIPLQAALWLRSRDRQARWLDFGLGLVAGAVYFWLCFSWLRTVTTAGWFVLCLYLAIYPALWAWLVGPLPTRMGAWLRGGWLKKKGIVSAAGQPLPEALLPVLSSRVNLACAVVAACCWTATEWLRAHVLGGFGWNRLGVASHDILGLIQIADFGGVTAISWLMAFCSTVATLTFVRFFLEVGRTKVRPHFDFTLTMALVGACFVYGVRALQNLDGESTPLRVAMIQPNIPQSIKWDAAYAEGILEKFTGMTRLAQPWGPELTLWPEAATPEPFFNDRTTFEIVRSLTGELAGSLLFGTLEFTIGKRQEPHDYNTAVFWQPPGREWQVYRKLHLVPFGEYVPLRKELPLLEKIVGDRVAGDFRAGEKPVVFKMEERPIRIAPLICFEDTLSQVARRFLTGAESANLFVNITNDAWFERSAGSWQHLANAQLRTVEFRRPMIRCANTGVTCIVDAGGRFQQILMADDGDTFIEGVLFGVVQVPLDPPETFYQRAGDWVSHASLALAALWLVFTVLPPAKPRQIGDDFP